MNTNVSRAVPFVVLAAIPLTAAHAAPDAAAKGKYLVYAGDCAACHTAPGGRYLAGGYALKTPFGTMYTPNITSDKATGIGDWSDDEFYALFHEGHGRGGKYIYPGFPYPWFTKVTRDDVTSILAYLKTVPAVDAPKKPNSLMFPLGFRPLMIGWNLMFFKPGEFKPDPARSDQLNRGAYLVEGLTHCSDCHTPKNIAQAPKDSNSWAGGMVDNWYAPNISSDPKDGIGGWSQAELVTYLKTGTSKDHGVALGPMAEAVRESFSHMTDADVQAMAAYVKTFPARKSYGARQPEYAGDVRPGAAVYATYCASCHQQNGQGVAGKIPALADNGAVTSKGPQNIIRVVLGGARAQGSYGPMPGYGTVMDVQQVADVTNYVRGAWANKAPETTGPDVVSTVAKETNTVLGATSSCPEPGDDMQKAFSDPSQPVQPLLTQLDEQNLTEQTNKIDAAAKSLSKNAKQPDVVNDLIDAYCRVLSADQSLQPQQRWERLTRFSESSYTQFTTKGKQ